MSEHMSEMGIGGSVRRKEDDRLMRGLGCYVADIKRPNMCEIAFVRSPIAHGRIVEIEIPDGAAERVFAGTDLSGVRPVRAVSTLDGFKASDYPPLALDKVRFVGEPVVMCLAETRAKAEDLAQDVFVDYDELPAITTVEAACADDSPKIHEHWDNNVSLGLEFGAPFEIEAPVKIRKRYRTARQCMVPLEGKGLVAEWNRGKAFLTVHSSPQIPHLVRRALAEIRLCSAI